MRCSTIWMMLAGIAVVSQVAAALAAAEPRVVFDVDLTQGRAGPGVVTGGSWDGGWRCTGAKDERIVFDAGAPIANGWLEASFTIAELPWASQQGKINYIGLHEDASLSQNKHEGDLFYARTGNITGLTVKGLRFLRVKLVDEGPAADSPPPAPLKVSENGRFLVAESGRPVFLLADTAWGLVNRLKRDEIEEYLRKRRSQRFNAVTFVLYTPGNPDITDGKANIYGQPPFELINGRFDVTRPRTTPGVSPDRAAEYDYWDHVDYTIQLTKRLGLYAVVLPCWGSAVVGDYGGKAGGEATVDAAGAAAYGRWLAERYGREPHVVWMLGGDRRAVYGDRDYRPVFQAMAKGLAAGGSKQLLSYHPPKRSPQSSDWFHTDAWLSFNSIQHWPEDQLAAMARDWQVSPAKPTWLFEGRYEGYWKNNYKPEDWGEWQCRQQAWQTVVAGAFGHTYGHERVFGFGKDSADWKAALDAPGARSMTHLAKLMNYFGPTNALTRLPDQSLLAGEEGKAERLASDRITVSRTGNNRCVLAYSAAGRPIRLHLDRLAPGTLFAWWFNPRTGAWHADGTETANCRFFAQDLPCGPGTPPREFDPPGDSVPGQDWVLVLSISEGL